MTRLSVCKMEEIGNGIINILLELLPTIFGLHPFIKDYPLFGNFLDNRHTMPDALLWTSHHPTVFPNFKQVKLVFAPNDVMAEIKETSKQISYEKHDWC